jgi:hypothetical protein
MAKVFRTESLNLGGNLLLEASSAGAFEIKSAQGSTLMSRGTIEADISSLQTVDTDNLSDLNADISSLNAVDTDNLSDLNADISSLNAVDTDNLSDLNADISSLNSVDTDNLSDLNADISSLNAVDTDNLSDVNVDISSLAAINSDGTSDLDVDISSLAHNISTNDVVAVSTSVGNGVDNSGSISFGRTFSSTPIVVAQLKSSNSSDPIIACMVSSVSTTAATVTFADSTPSSNYTVELIASIA